MVVSISSLTFRNHVASVIGTGRLATCPTSCSFCVAILESDGRAALRELRRVFEDSKTRFPKLDGEGNARSAGEVDGRAEPFAPGVLIGSGSFADAFRNPRL
jgi:hypothetical protein